jgi:protein ImuA
MHSPITLETLRQRVRLLERPAARHAGTLPFGVAEIDAHLPEHGLPVAALHEVSGGGEDAGPAASATLFVAGILGRLQGTVLWCAGAGDIFGPGLACAGLPPDRVLYAEASDEKTVFLVMEEALRHAALAAVVGEVSLLPMTASRRLVLAAEKSGVMAVALRRRPGGEDAPNAARTRWRISPLPSLPLPVPGIGRGRWHMELSRCRGGTPKSWIMEACDAQGCLGVPAELGDRSAASQRRAS